MHAPLTVSTYLLALGANVALLGFGFRVTKQVQRINESIVVKQSSTIAMASDLPGSNSDVEPSNTAEAEGVLSEFAVAEAPPTDDVTAASLFIAQGHMTQLSDTYLFTVQGYPYTPSFQFSALDGNPYGVLMSSYPTANPSYQLEPGNEAIVDDMLRIVCSSKLLSEVMAKGGFGRRETVKPFHLTGPHHMGDVPREVHVFGYLDTEQKKFLVVKYLYMAEAHKTSYSTPLLAEYLGNFQINNGPAMYLVNPVKKQGEIAEAFSFTDHRRCGASLGRVLVDTNY